MCENKKRNQAKAHEIGMREREKRDRRREKRDRRASVIKGDDVTADGGAPPSPIKYLSYFYLFSAFLSFALFFTPFVSFSLSFSFSLFL